MSITCIGSDENGHTYHFGTPPTDWKLPKGYMIKMDCYPGKFAEVVSNLKTEPWTGEGLPPVGTVCEWAGCTFAPEDPKEPDLHIGDHVKIIAHFKDGEFDLGAFTFNPQIHNPDRGTAWVNQGSHGCFRPIRTPEQIAAEERDKAIDEMAQDLGKFFSNPKVSARTIYDAGYRKQVTP